jgi:chromosome segregation ATPase
MADFERCYCGAMSHTPDGLCHRHATELARLRPKPPEPTLEEKLAECQAARHYLNEQLMTIRDERDEYKRKYRALKRDLELLKLGDIELWQVGA